MRRLPLLAHLRLLGHLALSIGLAYLAAWLTLGDVGWTDFEHANLIPLRALLDGELGRYLDAAGTYGSSMLLRAPFAFAAELWGASDLALFRTMAIPGLVAAVVLAMTVWSLRVGSRPGAQGSVIVIALVVANPLFHRALEMGHPEEMLGATLCIGAVLAALARKPYLAAVLLGLALANKAWAVLAIGPVLVALDSRRWTVLALAGAIAALFIAPSLLYSEFARSHVGRGAGTTDAIFLPWQLWWPLGEPGDAIRPFGGALAPPGYRAAPSWIAPLTHPLIAFLVVPMSLLWHRRHRAGAATADVLLLLALLLLLRCALDVANNSYYHLPFLLTLLAWESLRRDRLPVLSVLVTALVWLTLVILPGTLSPDAQHAAYVAWVAPTIGVLLYAVAGGRCPRWVPALGRATTATA